MEILSLIGICKHVKLNKKVIKFSFSVLMQILLTISRPLISNFHFLYIIFLLALVVDCLQALKV